MKIHEMEEMVLCAQIIEPEADELMGLVDADTPDDVVDLIVLLVDEGLARAQIVSALVALTKEVN